MAANTRSRRRFLKAGGLLSGPLALGAMSGAAGGTPSTELARLEALAEIRELQQRLSQSLEDQHAQSLAGLFIDGADAAILGNVRRLAAVGFGERDAIELGPAMDTASVTLPCMVDFERVIDGDSTLIDMARQQGDGVLRRSEQRLLEADVIRRDGAWRFARLELSRA